MDLDQPWKIAALIGLLLALRCVWAVWRQAPARPYMAELLDSGLIAVALVFLLIRPLVVQSFYIPSGSMEPTLMGPPKSEYNQQFGHQAAISYRPTGGDHILVNKFIYRLSAPERGDIIVFDAPPQALQGRGRSDFVKRLIGLPGDLVQIKKDIGVYIDGKLLQEPDAIPVPHYSWPVDEFGLPAERPYRVPPRCYFVLGDNRDASYDSHAWFLGDEPKPELETSRVLGKAMLIYWPPHRIGLISDHDQLHLGPTSQIATATGSGRSPGVGAQFIAPTGVMDHAPAAARHPRPRVAPSHPLVSRPTI
jgi:signal peptidase I